MGKQYPDKRFLHPCALGLSFRNKLSGHFCPINTCLPVRDFYKIVPTTPPTAKCLRKSSGKSVPVRLTIFRKTSNPRSWVFALKCYTSLSSVFRFTFYNPMVNTKGWFRICVNFVWYKRKYMEKRNKFTGMNGRMKRLIWDRDKCRISDCQSYVVSSKKLRISQHL